MSYVIEMITPRKAREYYNCSAGNRPISKTIVRSYADSMRQGKWLLNGVPIIFDVDGHLLDGHHRLLAIEMANIPVSMEVRRGVSPECFTTYDCGRHRTLGQILAMQQVKHYNTVGSIVACNETLVAHGKIWVNNNVVGRGVQRTNMDNYNLYMKDPEGFAWAAEETVRIIKEARFLKGSWVGGLLYYLTRTGGYDEKFVIRFFEAVCALGDGDIQPANVLRQRIVKERFSNTKITDSQLFAFVVIAWNAYVEGKKLTFLRFVPDNQEYPKLKLKKDAG